MEKLIRDFKKGWHQNDWQRVFLLTLFPSVLVAGALGELVPVLSNFFLGVAVVGSLLWAVIQDQKASVSQLETVAPIVHKRRRNQLLARRKVRRIVVHKQTRRAIVRPELAERLRGKQRLIVFRHNRANKRRNSLVPRTAEMLFFVFLSPETVDEVIEMTNASFNRRRKQYGLTYARSWYWWQVARTVPTALKERIVAAARATSR